MTEIWKDIPGFDLYQVSNLGRVKSRDWGMPNPLTGGMSKCKGQMLNPWLEKGYPRVGLSVNSKHYYRFVHRLVADAFIQKEWGKNVINHKDGNPQNNAVDNLEWCTPKENVWHATNILKRVGKNQKIVLDTLTGVHYVSAVDAYNIISPKMCLDGFRARLREGRGNLIYA